MQTNNTLILANYDFASKVKAAIKSVKIITNDWKHFTSLQFLKFSMAQIKLNSKKFLLIKKSYVGGIFPVINHDVDSTSWMKITKKKLSFKE